MVAFLSSMAPMPCIFKGFSMCFRILTALILEQHVAIAVGVERWVYVNEVYTLVRDVLAHDG
jgi:hypothetical protein